MRTSFDRPLPFPAIWLIGAATILLWIEFLVAAFSIARAGGVVAAYPHLGDEPIRIAFQDGLHAAGALFLMATGSWVVAHRVRQDPARERNGAILLLRGLIVVIVAAYLFGAVTLAIVGDAEIALGAAFLNLPLPLMTIGLLVCADRSLHQSHESVF